MIDRQEKIRILRDIGKDQNLRDLIEVAKELDLMDIPVKDLYPRPETQTRSWELWPEELKKEIDVVIQSIDSGRMVTMKSYLNRIREHWGVVVSRKTLVRYLQSRGRRGWTK